MDGLWKQQEESGQAVMDHQAEEGPSPWNPKTTVCEGHHGSGGAAWCPCLAQHPGLWDSGGWSPPSLPEVS